MSGNDDDDDDVEEDEDDSPRTRRAMQAPGPTLFALFSTACSANDDSEIQQ